MSTPNSTPAATAPNADDYDDIVAHTSAAPAKPVAATVPAETPTAGKPSHPAYLLSLAKDYGITDDDVNGMTTEELGRAVNFIHRRETSRAATVGRSTQPAPAPAPAAIVPTPDDEFDLGIKESDGYPPELLATLKKVQKTTADEIKLLKKQLAEQGQATQQQSAAEMYARADAAFSKHPEIFGAGSSREIIPGSPEAFKRHAALQHLQMLGQNGQHTTIENDIDTAARVLFGATSKPATPATPAATPAAAEIEQRKTAWKQAPLAKPTARAGASEPKGRKAAEAAVRTFLTEKGERVTNDGDPDAEADAFD